MTAIRSLPRILWRMFILLVFLAGAFAVPAQQSPQAPAPARPDLEALRQEVTQIEAQLARDTVTEGELSALRRRAEPMFPAIAQIIGKEQPRLEEINARLAEIGPKPKEGSPPESAEVQNSRAEQERLKSEVDENIRVTRLILVRVEQIMSAISDKRRTLFRRLILERSHSIASPWLWLDVVRAVPVAVDDLRAFMAFRVQRVAATADPARAATGLGLILLILFAVVPARRVQHRFVSAADLEDPSRYDKATLAVRRMLAPVVLPLMICAVLFGVLDLLDIMTDRLGELVRSIVLLVPLFAGLRGLAYALLSPDDARWRLFALRDETAQALFDMTRRIVWVLVIGKAVDAVNLAISSALPVTIATRGVTALLVALLVLTTVRRIDTLIEEDEEDLEASQRTSQSLLARSAALALSIGVIAATLLGYVALASFLTDQAVWIATLAAALALLFTLVEEALGRGANNGSAFFRHTRGLTGLSAGSVQQIGILSGGLIRILLIVAAVAGVLAPWGVDSNDMFGSLRAAIFGFQIGGTTVSLSSILSALIIFLIGVFVTRAIQRWLENRYLPSTTLDTGLRNSIKTIFGYVGVVVALLLGLGNLGISFEKLTIVAGALSVGIGFGLQSIVNNFVSGLILLWERPLRVGDWIVVGEEQGKVRRINVRATEIETFDRATLIVPNSEFISGRVKNWMHGDRTGRIMLPIGVSYAADPDVVQKLLLDVALAHREVLTEPPPRVFFMRLGDSSLDFELRCFADVDGMAITRSELLFEVFRRLKAAGIEVPYPHRTVEIADVGKLGQAIAENMPRTETK